MNEKRGTRILDCPWLDQREKWPTGCESVSAALCLQYAGFDVTPDYFIDNCLPRADAPRAENGLWRGPDPRFLYPGDPRTEDGWGCFAPAVRRGIETCASLRGFDLTVRELYGKPLDALFREEIDRGHPVILFASMGMRTPRESRRWIIDGTGEVCVWKTPMHCLLLIGYDGDSAVFSDPLAGPRERYSLRDTDIAYRGMGTQAVVVHPARRGNCVNGL